MWRPFVALLAIAIYLAVGSLTARAAAAPDVFITRAYAFRNAADDTSSGDILFLIRYELPLQNGTSTPATAEAWCAELTNTTGCTASPVNPTAPTSLPNGRAYARLKEVASGTVRAEQSLKRVGHAMLLLPLGAGHGLTWADSNLQVCIESSTTFFAPSSSECITPDWSTAASTQAAQRSDLGTKLLAVLRELEQERNVAFGTYVTNVGLITTDGQEFTREQTIAIERIVPTIFQTGSTRIASEDYVAPTPQGLTTKLAATATATTVYASLQGVGREFTGLQGTTFGIFAAVSVAVIGAVVAWTISKHAAVGGTVFLLVLAVGAYFAAPPIEVLMTLLLILAVPTAMWLVWKLRS